MKFEIYSIEKKRVQIPRGMTYISNNNLTVKKCKKIFWGTLPTNTRCTFVRGY